MLSVVQILDVCTINRNSKHYTLYCSDCPQGCLRDAGRILVLVGIIFGVTRLFMSLSRFRILDGARTGVSLSPACTVLI